MGEWHNNMWQWKLTWRRSMCGWEEEKLQELSNLMLNVMLDRGQQDAWCWRHTKEGIYTAKLGYLLLRDQQGGDDTKLFRKVWNKYIPNKGGTERYQPLVLGMPLCSKIVVEMSRMVGIELCEL
ncbi:hypothetical protein SLEP1_g9612 [Rubroshorea leprosula]|uniref:Uncharacterized protein n=1 Tax=Rubroshorea leprosula TaxID=152421 RepID=A0AAV5I9Z6_9ROSI|nr:hypothetical protein SLEP1_g9612 [Rubroshorea leprosula]